MNPTPAQRRSLNWFVIASAALSVLIALPLAALATVVMRRLGTTNLSSRLCLG